MNKKDFFLHNSLCPLPWTGIYVNPNGRIKNCAITMASLGNIHHTPLPEIMNNKINQQIRQDMLDGIRHERCNSCYQVEDNSKDQSFNESNRTWYKKIAIKNHQDFKIFDSTDQFVPTVLDLRWRNTCNRACIYSGPDLSSLWQDMMNMEYKIDESILEKSKNYVFDNLNSIKHVYLAGGEPLLIKENQLLLQRLFETNPEIEIRINSNIGNIKTPVFTLLEKFKHVKWTISLDSKEKSFEYMRWPGKWSEFMSNLHEIHNLVGDSINFNMVWCILNDRDIIDTIDFLIDQGFHENMFIIQCLTFPKTLDVRNLPAAERSFLQNLIEKRKEQSNSNYWLYKSLSSMYNFLEKNEISGPDMFFDQISLEPGLGGTFRFLERIDQMRGTDSSQIFTRLYQYK